ncbi:MAG TPA: zf-HC2 domain-containing protein [Acidimicrobiales bacterium]|nr:zf-HC2 domain-containing protein [Acidimicrobiales bacterium]
MSHLGDAISALLDGELSAEEEAVVRAHLDECAACREELAAVERVRRLVRGLPVVERRARRRGPSRVAAVAAGAVAAAASIVFLATASAPQAPGPPSVDRLVDVHATSGATAEPVSQLTPVVFNE